MIIIGDGIPNSLFGWGNRPASEQHFDHTRRDKLQLIASDFEIEARDSWRSPLSGDSYPLSWVVRRTQQVLMLEISPYLLVQEINLSYLYWEEAVKDNSSNSGKPIPAL